MGAYQPTLKSYYKLISDLGGPRFKHQFNIRIVGLSELDANNSDVSNFQFMCTSTKIPKVSLTQSTKVNFLAMQFKFPGIIKYDDTWTVKIKLDQNMIIYKLLLAWKDTFSSILNNNGGIKVIPNVYADVTLLDNTMNVAQSEFKIHGIWPKQIGQIQYAYAQGESNPTQCDVVFSMQWLQQVGQIY